MGAGDSLLKRGRLEAQQLSEPLDVEHDPLDFEAALGPRGDPGRLADLALDEGDQLGERGPLSGADVEDGGRVVPAEQVGDHPGDVAGVEVVADRGAVAVEDDLLAAFDVMEEGDDRALAPVGLLVLAVEGRAAQDPGPEAGLLTRPAD